MESSIFLNSQFNPDSLNKTMKLLKPENLFTAGAVYTLYNSGNVQDSFTMTVIVTDPANQTVNKAQSFVWVVTGTITSTPSLTNTRITSGTLLQPITLNLKPCKNANSDVCQFVHLVIVTSNSKNVTDSPAKLTLKFVPHSRKSEPIELVVTIDSGSGLPRLDK